MKAKLFLSLAGTLLALTVCAGSRSSASYSVPADAVDNGGGRSTSAAYVHDGSAGGVAGLGTVALPAQVAKHGYVGQLYEVTGLTLSANPTNINEGGTRQLAANAVLDDATFLNVTAASVTWSVLNGPLTSINAAGLASATNVYQDTPATAQGSFLSRVGALGLLVLNVGNDDFGGYASDGLEDAWQVQNFGLDNPNAGPNADPDGDGQNNSYEFTVGSIPTDSASYFRFRIELVPGQPAHRNLIFSPRVDGRTYTVQYKLDLGTAGFDDLAGFSSTDVGSTRTVKDPNATESEKFYRVRITLP